jgi:hypothetical protein
MSEYIVREIDCGLATRHEIVGELVRCKDCMHFEGEGMYRARDIIVQYDHFYCYHGERKDDVSDMDVGKKEDEE